MSRGLPSFLQSLNQALQNQEGDYAAQIIKSEFQTFSAVKTITNEKQQWDNVNRYIGDQNDKKFVMELLKMIRHGSQDDYVEASNVTPELVRLFTTNIFTSNGGWAVPITIVLTTQVRKYAEKAEKRWEEEHGTEQDGGDDDDKNVDDSTKELTPLARAASTIITIYRLTAAEKSTQNRKRAQLHVTNTLMMIYFRINKLRLCKNLMGPIENPQMNFPFSSFPMCDRVTYKYFAGRLAMYESDFSTARERLEYAFGHCHKDAINNKRTILTFLLSVNLVLGKSPTLAMLQKYQMDEYYDLVQAYRTGNLRLYQDSLETHQELFIQKGIYLILDRAVTIVYRNLIKRIVGLQKDPSRLNLRDVQTCIRYLGTDMDLDEVECIMSGLIFKGYIKGYISHSKQMAVLSKVAAFPSVSQ